MHGSLDRVLMSSRNYYAETVLQCGHVYFSHQTEAEIAIVMIVFLELLFKALEGRNEVFEDLYFRRV